MRIKRSALWLFVSLCMVWGVLDIFVKFASQNVAFPGPDMNREFQWGAINISALRSSVLSVGGNMWGQGFVKGSMNSSAYYDDESLNGGRGPLNLFERSADESKIHNGILYDTNMPLNRERLSSRLENAKGPRDHIAFLKVHMAGSTPIQTMFFRYGYEKNLSFVLPSKGHYFTKSTNYPEPILPPQHGTHFDIVCNHACFNYSLYSSLMPSDTVYIAIVRDPYKQFLYSYHYYLRFFSFAYLTKIPYPQIENLIRYPDKYDESCLSYTMNAMARDFGFEKYHFYEYAVGSEDSSAQKYLDEISKVFDLVLVFEKYEESLILMKRLLKWSLKSILFIPEKEEVSEMPLTAPLLKQFKSRNRLDYLVYDYFTKVFEEKIREAGEGLVEETLNFKMALKTVRMWCDYQYFGTLTIPATKWNEEFEVTSTDCDLIGKSEFAFMDILKGEKKV